MNHALGRLLERTSFQADPVVVMLEAHDALLATFSGVARTMLEIPGGSGGFLVTMRGLTNGGDALMLAAAETWVRRTRSGRSRMRK
jgi:hypothetical protein